MSLRPMRPKYHSCPPFRVANPSRNVAIRGCRGFLWKSMYAPGVPCAYQHPNPDIAAVQATDRWKAGDRPKLSIGRGLGASVCNAGSVQTSCRRGYIELKPSCRDKTSTASVGAPVIAAHCSHRESDHAAMQIERCTWRLLVVSVVGCARAVVRCR